MFEVDAGDAHNHGGHEQCKQHIADDEDDQLTILVRAYDGPFTGASSRLFVGLLAGLSGCQRNLPTNCVDEASTSLTLSLKSSLKGMKGRRTVR